jgi:signal transduction histidine kinase
MLQDSLFKYSADNSLEMMFIFDDNGRIVYVNKKALHLLEYEDLCGSIVNEVFPGIMDNMEDTVNIDSEPVYEPMRELMAYRKNKTCFPALIKLHHENGYYYCMGFDASERNLLKKQADNAEQEVEAALKVKSQFVANITHELRTPVNGILGNTQSLMEIEENPEKKRLLGLVERGCNDMHSIINSILDFSKLEAGKFTLENREFNFRNMVDYVKSNHIHRITEKGLDFTVSVAPDIPEIVIGDELRIVQILNNLISNAYKFTTVGKISLDIVKTAQIKNRIELFFLVIDTGIGIDAAAQEKLFKSFSQVDASISRKYGGTGLGLNISKQLVELMNGNIRVESEKGRGSMFSFHIWLELPKEEWKDTEEHTDTVEELSRIRSTFIEEEDKKKMFHFGGTENIKEITKKLSKLLLCVDMENWEKAEMFSEGIRQLTADAPGEIKTAVLRLKMAVQKGDAEKSSKACAKLQELLKPYAEDVM